MSVNQGLEDVIVAETKLSKVDGLAGKLTIFGYSLEELAPNASYEETLFLLWHDKLPNSSELAEFNKDMRSLRNLNDVAKYTLKEAANKRIHPMDALRLTSTTLVLDDPNPLDNSYSTNIARVRKMTACFPTIIANYWRLKEGKDYIEPRDDLDHAENFLYMLTGKEPTKESARGLEIYLNTVADHGLNASTFTARVIASTDSDINSALTGAIGALKGPKHGGAPGPALDMIFEIEKVENTEPYIRKKLENRELIMGFGHRVYKVRDPRAEVLSKAAENLFVGDKREFFDMVKEVERIIVRLFEEYKPGRNIQTNVEFYTALLLHGCELKPDIFSSIFAMGRVAGWGAHVLEQMQNNRIMRPKSLYKGEFDKTWVPIEDRD